MSENVISMKKSDLNKGKKLEDFLKNNRKLFLIIFAILVVFLVASVSIGISLESAKNKNLSAIDKISYEYTKDSYSLTDEEVTERKNNTIDALNPYISKKGIAGVRANLLLAEIHFSNKNYEEASKAYDKASSLNKKSYVAPIAYFNNAVCKEELGELELAAELYGKAASCDDFLLVTHALFSQGRVLETVEKYDEASSVYQKLVDAYPANIWANLANSRLVSLEVEGKLSK